MSEICVWKAKVKNMFGLPIRKFIDNILYTQA